jgi:hypothetical protein
MAVVARKGLMTCVTAAASSGNTNWSVEAYCVCAGTFDVKAVQMWCCRCCTTLLEVVTPDGVALADTTALIVVIHY